MKKPLFLCLVVGVFLCARGAVAGKPAGLQAALAAQAPSLNPTVLSRGLAATRQAWKAGHGTRRSRLTIIDYSLPSTEKRLWVFDLDTQKVLFHELVAHGRNTGENRAEHFSNEVGSKQSSVGLFETAQTYSGKHGYSLYLDGLEVGFNDHARERAIVIHGADYATPAFAARYGRLGRSWGCPALDERVSREVIDAIKGGSLLFVYYPDPTWLSESQFLDSDR